MVSFTKKYIYTNSNIMCGDKICTIKDIFVDIPKIFSLKIEYNHECIIINEYKYKKNKYYFTISWNYKSIFQRILVNIISEIPSIYKLCVKVNWNIILPLFDKSKYIISYHMRNSFTNKHLDKITHIFANNTNECEITSLKDIKINILHRKFEKILDMLYAMPLDATDIGILFVDKKHPDDNNVELQIVDMIWKRLKEFTELKTLYFKSHYGVVTPFIQNDNLLLNLKEFNTNFNFNVQYFIENSCVQKICCNSCNVDQDIIKQSCLVECIGPNCEELQLILDNNRDKIRFIHTKVILH